MNEWVNDKQLLRLRAARFIIIPWISKEELARTMIARDWYVTLCKTMQRQDNAPRISVLDLDE